MNLTNLIALGLLSVALCLVLGGGFLGSIPLVEDVDQILAHQGSPLPNPQGSILTDSPPLTAVVLFSFLGLPGGLVAAAGVALWFVGRRRQALQPPTSRRRILLAQTAGLVLSAIGLVPLLATLPTVILAPYTIPIQRESGLLPGVEHPLFFFVLALVLFAAGPLAFGSGLLALAGRCWRALPPYSANNAELEEAQASRERWNLRFERFSLFLGCGVVLALGLVGFLMFNKVMSEYLTQSSPSTAQERIALTPGGYLSSIFWLAIPAQILTFLIVGIRLCLVRSEPLPALQDRI